MSFVLGMLLIWAIAMAAWFLVSKYVRSSDVDRIKARLTGTTKTQAAKKAKGAAAAPAAVIHQTESPKNKFAQMLVDKYRLGPKLHIFLEQAGVNWLPARFVHTSLVLFIVGFAFGWLMLGSITKVMALATGMIAGSGPFIYVWFKRRTRL